MMARKNEEYDFDNMDLHDMNTESVKDYGREELFDQSVAKEKYEARVRFDALRRYVVDHYRSSESAIRDHPETIETYNAHNEAVLDTAIEIGKEKGLNETSLRILEVGMIVHDMYKGARVPGQEEPQSLKGTPYEGLSDSERRTLLKKQGFSEDEIKNLRDVPYILVAHGQMAAVDVKRLVNDPSLKIMEGIFGGDEYSHEDTQAVVWQLETMIRSHMGPDPGFMGVTRDKVNARLKTLGRKEIEHPRPPQADLISQTALAADMSELAGPGGWEKVICGIRSKQDNWRKDDQKTVRDYKSFGIDLTVGEAALLSVDESGENAYNMIKDPRDKQRLSEMLALARQKTYVYETPDGYREEVNYARASLKQARYREKVDANTIKVKTS